MHRLASIATIATVSLVICGCGSVFYMGQHPSVSHDPPRTEMREDLREQVRTVTVITDGHKPNLVVSGDYGDVLPTAGDGAKAGAKAGAMLTGEMVAADPRTAILAPVMLPVFMITGSVIGATAAKIQKEIQEFRDGLAEDLAVDDDRPQPGDQLVEELIVYLEANDNVTPVTEGADAELALSITHIDIHTDDEDAVIITNIHATLRDTSSGTVMFERHFEYGERDSLRNWAADDNAAWAPYAENTRRFLAAEIAAVLFERIQVRHVLRPAQTETFSGDWDASVRSDLPTLAWELFLLDDSGPGADLSRAVARYDLQVLDRGRLVYSAREIAGTSHKIATSLDNCRFLYWSVRPVYRFDEKVRTGNWMYMESGFDKVKASTKTHQANETPEFWKQFARLRTRCAS